MKKILSVFLSFTLIVTAFITPVSVAAESNLVTVIRNTYDEVGVSYKSYNGKADDALINDETDIKTIDAYTIRTYNSKELQITNYDTVIREESRGNYAALFGEHNNGNLNYGYPNTLWIYDSSDSDLGLFTPKTNMSYTITVKYRSDGIDYGKSIYLTLARKSNHAANVFSDENVYVEKLAYINSKSSDWQTATATFETGAEVSQLYIAMHSDNDWWNSNTKLWVDNIEIVEGKPVILPDGNIINTYDESEATYDNYGTLSTDSQQSARTDRTVNGVKLENFALWDAQINQTCGINGENTYAVHFGCHQNGENAKSGGNPWPWNNTVRIYDSDSSNLEIFTPQANSKYKISLNYRADIDFADAKSVKLNLIYAPSATALTYIPENKIIDSIAVISSRTDGWKTAEAEFETGEDVKPLLLIMQTAGTEWWCSNVDIWVDNISLTLLETKEPIEETTEDEPLNTDSFIYVPVIDEDFSDVAVNSLPDGWSREYAYTFLWSADTATGLTADTVGVKDDNGIKYLQYKSTNGAHILTLSEVKTQNYRFTSRVRFNTLTTGTFGLVTDIFEEPSETMDVTISALTATGNDGNGISMFSRIWKTQNYYGVDNGKKIISASEAFANGIKPDTDIELTVYHYNNRTYYYINDIFIASMNDYGGGDRTRVGFYNSYGADMKIYSVNVDAIYDVSEIDSALYPSRTLVSQDFSNVSAGNLPDGWSRDYAYTFLWAADKATGLVGNTVGVQSENGDNYLKYNSKDGGHIITLPSLGTDNYIFTTSFEFISVASGTFGIANNIADDYTTAEGATIASVTPNYGVNGISLFGRLYTGTNYVGTDSGLQSYDIADFFDGNSPVVGQEIIATVYHYNKNTYYFINDKFVGSIADHNKGTGTRVGFYNYGANVAIKSVTVNEIAPAKEIDSLSIDGVSIRYANENGDVSDNAGGINIKASLVKADEIYAKALTDGDEITIGMLFASKDSLAGKPLTALSKSALNTENVNLTDDNGKFSFNLKILNLSSENLDSRYITRAYLKVCSGEIDHYYYSAPLQVCPARLANKVYNKSNNDVKAMVTQMYNKTTDFEGENALKVKFSLFSDFHYKEGQYMSSIADLNAIFKRANNNGVDFVLQCGDFCNDFIGSPELTNAYLKNSYGLPAYGVYGNHELESANNSMEYVTPRITNQNNNVVWGTQDGKISSDGSIGYYYFDSKGFRVICTDTNYSFNPTKNIWQHNETCSFGPPSGNINVNALGPEQMKWLEDVLIDSANEKIPCIVVSHASLNTKFADASSQADIIAELFNRVNEIREGTIIASLSGHSHLNRMEVMDNIAHISVNTTRNGWWWIMNGQQHYTDETFIQVKYDDNGDPINGSGESVLLSSLIQGPNTWFFADPLNCVVSVSSTGEIEVEGMQSEWLYGIEPDIQNNSTIMPYAVPYISNASFDLTFKN